MKKRFEHPLIMIWILLFCVVFPLAGQEQTTLSETPGFGLQADIFRNVRNVRTDFSINFSSLRDYTLTPGDRFTLTVNPGIFDTGNGQAVARDITYAVQLQEDYTLDVPILGEVNVEGMSLPEVQRRIAADIRQAMTAQYASFILSAPAQFNVFVYGGVMQPGHIVATPLVTLVDAIAMARGFKPGASYRSIQLQRDGEIINMDISKYYAQADFTSNPALQPGDTVFVPAAEVVANIEGTVTYPGTYELLPGESLSTLLALAGGVLPGSNRSDIEIGSLDENGVRRVVYVDEKDADGIAISQGDIVSVRAAVENPSTVSIEGAVYGSRQSGTKPVVVPTRPVRVDFPYYPEITVFDLLNGVGGPTPYAQFERAVVVRSDSHERVLLDVESLWKNDDRIKNVVLQPGDLVLIPMERLLVYITGSVNDPGAVPYMAGTTVGDYVLQAGGIDENEANPKALFLVDIEGNRTRLTATDEPDPGSVLYVGKRALFQTDRQVSNTLIAAGWVTSVIVVITQIWEFLILVGVL